MVGPAAYYDMYDPAAIDVPGNWSPQPGESSFMASSYCRKQFEEFGADFYAWRKSIAVYWGYATYIDHLMGRFLDRCEELSLLDNTMVIMVSDHGEMLGQHGLNQKMSPSKKTSMSRVSLHGPAPWHRGRAATPTRV